jgi:hypothetical protein
MSQGAGKAAFAGLGDGRAAEADRDRVANRPEGQLAGLDHRLGARLAGERDRVVKSTSSPQVEARAANGAAAWSASAIGVSRSSARITTSPIMSLSRRMSSPYTRRSR